ncbi:UPF0764 protein C16orf89-like [Branchiostoma floridae]|uniref:UPF0764 protein C16orf89-like n=1 Tax=Branchiostoma floridae TaxID=7739 RepID=A0A9J7M5Q7_BRAFL|nr:UPF0764 protein C16orf89-like [Branchiostoma floridae]
MRERAGYSTLFRQLTVLLRRLRTGRVQAEPEQLQQIASLQERAAHLADRTLPELERQDKDYYTKLSPIVQPGFWESDVTGRTTDSALLSPPSIPRDHPFSEDDSDRCLSELLGTGQNGDQKCQISDACWEMMTSPSYTGYWLTHELFYLEVL